MVNLESSILGAMLLDEEAASIGLDILKSYDFDLEEHVKVFNAIKKTVDAGEKVAYATVAQRYGDINYLLDLTENVATTKLIKSECLALKNNHRKVNLTQRLSNIVNQSQDMSLDEILLRVSKIAQSDDYDFKVERVRNLDRTPYKGVSSLQGKYVPMGIPTLDNALNDLAPGCVTLLTGRANAGKSTLASQIMANAIDNGNKVFLVAGEGIEEMIVNRLYQAVIGKEERFYMRRKVNKRIFKEPTDYALKHLQAWHKNKLSIFSKGESRLKTTDELFSLMKTEVKTNKPDLIVIDNLMSVLTVSSANEKLNAQADFMQRCCDLAKASNNHIILVLHPRKQITKGDMDFEDISGTQDLANKADNIISIKRCEEETEGKHGVVKILKNRYFSERPEVNVYFDHDRGVFLEQDQMGACYEFSFNWLPEKQKPELIEGMREVILPFPGESGK